MSAKSLSQLTTAQLETMQAATTPRALSHQPADGTRAAVATGPGATRGGGAASEAGAASVRASTMWPETSNSHLRGLCGTPSSGRRRRTKS